MAQPKIGRDAVERMESRRTEDPDATGAYRADLIPPDPPAVDFSLEDAAEMLIRCLPEPTQEKIHEVSAMHGKPVWQVLLGYAHKISEWGQLFSPVYLAQWDDSETVVMERICQTCRAIFTSPVPDGMYCCSHCYFGKLDEQHGHAKDCLIPKTDSVA